MKFLFNLFKKAQQERPRLIPNHIGIIMDGNGRWAERRRLPRTAGHTAGTNNFRNVTKYCSGIGVPYLTVFAFSSENWRRPEEEVSALMKLFKQYLEEALSDFGKENIKVNFIGDTSVFSDELKKLIDKVGESSKNCTGMNLNIAMNYGGRKEIIKAAAEIAEDIVSGKITDTDKISEDMFCEKLYTCGQPDVDLIIRPGGEYRISNFLLWQSAYAEYIFTDVLWPDFKTQDIDRALEEYSERNRRFGGI